MAASRVDRVIQKGLSGLDICRTVEKSGEGIHENGMA